jgi:hypothetical protein
MLDQIKIASPCSADWEQMKGTDRVRFCGECKKNVFNLSAMTRRDAEALLKQTKGKLCARWYRRADGTVLTEDLPVGLRGKVARERRRVSWAIAAALGFATAAFGQDAAVLSGKVRDVTDAVVPETTITVTNPKTGASRQVMTDSTGTFRLGSLAPGTYTVKAVRAGIGAFSQTDINVTPTTEATLDIVLQHGPWIDVIDDPVEQQLIISGRVTDASGAPVPDTTITVTDSKTGNPRTIKTDGVGKFRMGSLARGSYSIKAVASGFRQFSLGEVAVPGKGPRQFSLSDVVEIDTGETTVDIRLEISALMGDVVFVEKPKPWWRRLL